jgi:uncharacterized protein (TIGR03437 family)
LIRTVAALTGGWSVFLTSHAAKPGQVVIAYGAGQGPLNIPVPTGAPAPSNPPATTVAPTTVTVGGVPATVQFNGLAHGKVALWEIRFVVPSLPPGNYPLVATVAPAPAVSSDSDSITGVSNLAVTVSVSN